MLKINDIIKSLFSDEGFCTKYFCVKCSNEVKVKIYIDKDGYSVVEFDDKKPSINIKFISFNLNAIYLGDEGGYLSIGILPKIPFKYEWVLVPSGKIEDSYFE